MSSCNSDLIELLQRNLQDKRYLIVLDDVWNSNVWIELSSGLGDNNSGDRVIITTRLKDVAVLAAESHALGLQNLHESEAWDLFCRWAFRNIEDRRCPEELEQWARKILGKCHGLPLAIVAAGNLLSFKRMDVAEWIRFYSEINLDNQNLSPVARVLNLSYNHLPSHLKSCFLFCSIFPEDYLIHRKRLIRLWVAEGLVEEKRGKTLEQVAEEYLNELVGHCLLQILVRNDFGRIRSCQMHDLVRELALSTSAKENFCMIYDKSEVRIVDHNVHRMSLDGYTDTIQSTINFSHLRSFYLFDANSSPSSLISCTARYLRVLDRQNVPIETPPDDLFNPFNLRYLGLRNTRVRELPKSLGKLRRLQTLDLCNTKIEKLPSRITQLRHLFADKELDTNFRTFHDCSGVQTPKGLWDLRNLQTLQDIEASTELVRQLGKLTQLRSLRIRTVKRIHCRELFTSIGKMHFLSNLSVFASDENEYLILEALNPLPSHLLTFCLKGRLPVETLRTPLFHAIGVNLKRLWLGWNGLKEDPLPALSCISNPTFLHLQKAYEGESLSFHVGWFPKLRRLDLIDLPKVQVISVENTMQELVELWLIALPQLKKAPQGIKYVTSLQEIFLRDMHPNFIKHIQRAAKVKVYGHGYATKRKAYQNMEGVWTAKVSESP